MGDDVGRLWAEQDRHPGDRRRLFGAVAEVVEATSVLYQGSFVDISPSVVFPSVTYVDTDARAARFFADEAAVREIVVRHDDAPAEPDIRFIRGDYTGGLGLRDGAFDLLVSLFAGFVSEHCARYLRVGGVLLVNPSHGHVAMASIDERLRLTGVVLARSGGYRVRSEGLEEYLVPKSPVPLTPELLRRRGRGIAYTRSAFAYLFTRQR
jgi:hypothetical protein